MHKNISRYSQYKNDLFNKLNFPFISGKKILDVGCGDGSDAPIFIKEYHLKWHGTDVYHDVNVKKQKLNFKLGTIYSLPYKTSYFDCVFVHDVLHHIDESKQRKTKHVAGLMELRRVCKTDGYIIIVEGNRYNPLFYPHMVLIRGHNHFKQTYFKEIVRKVFTKDRISFKFFEAHLYPSKLLGLFKLYEIVMELIIPADFRAYNVAIVNKR